MTVRSPPGLRHGIGRAPTRCRHMDGTLTCQVQKSTAGRPMERIRCPARWTLRRMRRWPMKRSTRSSPSSTRSVSAGRGPARNSSLEPELGRAIVAQRVGELVDRGLMRRARSADTGGRPPRQLAFRADAGHVLVADLGATSIDVALTALDGRMHWPIAIDTHSRPARRTCLNRVDALFDSLVRTTTGIPGRLCGVGIRVPGPVEFDSGRPISPPFVPDRTATQIPGSDSPGALSRPVCVDGDVRIWPSGSGGRGSRPATTT